MVGVRCFMGGEGCFWRVKAGLSGFKRVFKYLQNRSKRLRCAPGVGQTPTAPILEVSVTCMSAAGCISRNWAGVCVWGFRKNRERKAGLAEHLPVSPSRSMRDERIMAHRNQRVHCFRENVKSALLHGKLAIKKSFVRSKSWCIRCISSSSGEIAASGASRMMFPPISKTEPAESKASYCATGLVEIVDS